MPAHRAGDHLDEQWAARGDQLDRRRLAFGPEREAKVAAEQVVLRHPEHRRGGRVAEHDDALGIDDQEAVARVFDDAAIDAIHIDGADLGRDGAAGHPGRPRGAAEGFAHDCPPLNRRPVRQRLFSMTRPLHHTFEWILFVVETILGTTAFAGKGWPRKSVKIG